MTLFAQLLIRFLIFISDFHIVNFSDLSGNIPTALAYGTSHSSLDMVGLSIRAVPEINLWGGVDGKKLFLVGGGTFHN